MTNKSIRARLTACSLEKGNCLSVSTAVKITVSTLNNCSRQGFDVLTRPAIKVLYPRRKSWIVKNIANIISTLRLPLSVIVVVYMLYPAYISRNLESLYFSLFVMLIILLSDGLDGAMARGLDSVSRYGKAVDPVADKVLYISMAISLMFGAWQLINREIVITMMVCVACAVYYEIRIVAIAIATEKECRIRNAAEPTGANMWGKAKFALQASAGFVGFGLPWVTAGFSLSMCLVVLALPMAHMSLRGHQLDLEAIRTKSII